MGEVLSNCWYKFDQLELTRVKNCSFIWQVFWVSLHCWNDVASSTTSSIGAMARAVGFLERTKAGVSIDHLDLNLSGNQTKRPLQRRRSLLQGSSGLRVNWFAESACSVPIGRKKRARRRKRGHQEKRTASSSDRVQPVQDSHATNLCSVFLLSPLQRSLDHGRRELIEKCCSEWTAICNRKTSRLCSWLRSQRSLPLTIYDQFILDVMIARGRIGEAAGD